MRHAAYEEYANALIHLSDADLVERTASQLELCRRDRKSDDDWQRLGLCEAEAQRRIGEDGKNKHGLYRQGCDLADQRKAEARRINQGEQS